MHIPYILFKDRSYWFSRAEKNSVVTGCSCIVNDNKRGLIILFLFFYVYQSEFLKNLIVRAGDWDVYTKIERYRDQNREIREVVAHKQNADNENMNGLVMVFLKSAFVLNKHVATICLPPQGYTFIPGENCNSCSWRSDETPYKRRTSNYNFLPNYIVLV